MTLSNKAKKSLEVALGESSSPEKSASKEIIKEVSPQWEKSAVTTSWDTGDIELTAFQKEVGDELWIRAQVRINTALPRAVYTFLEFYLPPEYEVDEEKLGINPDTTNFPLKGVIPIGEATLWEESDQYYKGRVCYGDDFANERRIQVLYPKYSSVDALMERVDKFSPFAQDPTVETHVIFKIPVVKK